MRLIEKARESNALRDAKFPRPAFEIASLGPVTDKDGKGYWLKWIGEDHPIAPAMPFFEFAIPRSGLSKPVFASSTFEAHMAQAPQSGAGATLHGGR